MREVVKLSYPESTIAVVAMEDCESCNTFSQEIIEGLIKSFDIIANNKSLKVVIIHGYENYFCCGGTKEELLNIYEGKITFADFTCYRLPLECEIPTIAAMQGHALGGGLAFGCYADQVIFAEECLYSANFMKYGFTPGMGATYMLPKKLGENIGHEMLYSAKNYYGGTLKSRGASFVVVKKQEVIAAALEMAKEISDKPRTSLVTLKQHLTQPIKAALPAAIIEQELEMHRITFAQLEVKTRIEILFGQ